MSTATTSTKKWLIAWLGAFPAAVIVNFIRMSLDGPARRGLGWLSLLLVAYFLLGWIPVLITAGAKKVKA